ncbi:MAG: FadR family transcriptional regulator [Firmicutes bacterium]|nr:FadR family transcriptional regulator [Bacillota bacterium]
MSHIKRTKLYEEVMDRILEMIKSNQMKEGDKLQSEKELASNFGVSRMAIREALSALQSIGLIEVKHGSGIYLRDVNEQLTNPISIKLLAGKDNLLNILELRKGLETEAAALTATRANTGDIKKLEEILQQMSHDINMGGTAADEDFNFHRALVRATGNPVYAKVFDTIANVFYEGLKSSHTIFKANLGPRLVVLEEHNLILDCIQRGKPEAAREAMRVHLENVESKLRGLLASRLDKGGKRTR